MAEAACAKKIDRRVGEKMRERKGEEVALQSRTSNQLSVIPKGMINDQKGAKERNATNPGCRETTREIK